MGLDATVYQDDLEERRITSARLGNMALIMHLFAVISGAVPTATVMIEKVLYSGTHTGDRITVEEVRQLRCELDKVEQAISGDVEVVAFVSRLRAVVEVALQNERPITF
jgi:hypothetical protein